MLLALIWVPFWMLVFYLINKFLGGNSDEDN